MASIKKAWFCKSCGSQHPQWLGQCKSCNDWNTLTEEVLEKETKESTSWSSGAINTPLQISQIDRHDEERNATGDLEFDRVLGGGIVPGSLCLLGGEPGIGKSTLLLQIAIKKGRNVLYVSGEESVQQIKMRAERIGIEDDGCHVLAEVSTVKILEAAEKISPDLLIIDSIQTSYAPHLDSSAGSVSQIKEAASEFLRYSKSRHVPVILVGHITKDGNLAGPKILEHMVDVVLQFEGDRHHLYRMLRSLKNRFGSTQELGIYQMNNQGLQGVTNPSGVLLNQREEGRSGSAIGVPCEGTQPLLVEVQALVSPAVYGTPQRSCTGFDTRRLNMLLAVLEKRCGFRLGAKDVFLNITGGIRIEDPALDLAVCAAILSSNSDIPIPARTAFAAEVGLSGEIRPVNRMEQRINEAKKLGFETFFYAELSDAKSSSSSIDCVTIKIMEQLVASLFG
ncbi:MAG: DNA repair protein RadA [Owenweeksia sp. TMED14]|nr:MAG: DNA repair protein RadA [Owenweeksia sp. TMED14]|tara:strand:- start:2032 stop:3384 length:1353 start_codon:yes stop_codon:yes gene_type:complete